MGTTTVGNWGRWGTEDELGALNLLTPETVRAAAGLVRTGRTYSLALPIQSDGVPLVPYRGVPMRMTLVNQADDGFGAPGVGANEDVLVVASHNETHMDALCHVHHDANIYNGFPASSMKTHGGATRCGIEKVGCLVGRAVLLDVCALHGVDALTSPHVITADELTACARRQGVELGSGDFLLIHTGWVRRFLDDPSDHSMLMNQPGIGADACRLIASLDVAAVGADNSAVEAIPFDNDDFLVAHVELLVNHGVYLLEHLVLDEMVRDEVWESLLVVAPLPITGGTGSPINPIAIA